jgi:hypothetical protein
MPEPRINVLASRELLRQVCALLEPFRDDAVLIGGWVPEIRFPDAGYVGTIDVDFATRLSAEGHRQVVALLRQNGFRAGAEPYQFVKNLPVDGRSYAVRLDLLTSRRHHQAVFGGNVESPHPAAGADLAFTDNSLETVGAVEVRVASIVALIVMKAHALRGREKPKDAYDLVFCLENFSGGVPALAAEFAAVLGDPEVRAILGELAVKFRDEEASGPRAVVEVEEPMGEARAIRKFAVFTLVDDFLRALGVVA